MLAANRRVAAYMISPFQLHSVSGIPAASADTRSISIPEPGSSILAREWELNRLADRLEELALGRAFSEG